MTLNSGNTTKFSMNEELNSLLYLSPDSCDPNPCDNGGTCTAVGIGYTCVCVAAFAGNSCQYDAAGKSSSRSPVNSDRVGRQLSIKILPTKHDKGD